MLRLDDPRQLWRRYGLALCLVLALLGASHLASVRSLSGGEEAAAVVNLSGRQRMLSQRILFLSLEATEGGGRADPRLRAAVDLFERSHDALVRGGSLGLSREGAALRAPVYADRSADGGSLDELSRSFAADARLVLDGTPREAEAAWRRMREVGPTTLLTRLDGAVQAFEGAASARTSRARTVARATFALAMVVLAVEALVIFLPAQRMVSAAIADLRAANARQERARREATARADEAQAARDEARRAMGVRSEFLANMNHELRTPLNGVIGMLELVGDAPDPVVAERARIALASASHLLTVLEDMLDLTRLESGALRTERVPFDPRAVAEGAAAALAAAASEKGLALRAELDPLPETVSGDAARLRQVLLNLLGNAVKFTEAGEVVLRASHRDGRLAIEVADTGPGIAEAAVATLFEPLVQGDGSTTRRHGGLGTGLALCRSLVEAMGGTIAFEPAPDWGSVFRVVLPAPTAADRARVAPGRLRVLVAEDNAVNRKVAEAFLRRLGHEPVSVVDGARAVEAVRDADPPFDLALMDIQMPVMDGIEATRTIRRLGPRGALPILAVSASALGDRADALREAGVDGRLSKPVTVETLSEAIADAVWEAHARGRAPGVRRASA